MLDSLMKFGAYRVNYFEPFLKNSPEAFGFYIRAEIEQGQAYSHMAKHQLYVGLDLIQRILGMQNLVGIYIDIDCLSNLQRPAYQQMKQDILSGYFQRILVLEKDTIDGCPGAVTDLAKLADRIGGLELSSWQDSKLVEKIV